MQQDYKKELLLTFFVGIQLSMQNPNAKDINIDDNDNFKLLSLNLRNKQFFNKHNIKNAHLKIMCPKLFD